MLEKSAGKKAFSHNVATEREEGKKESQAVAIAYSVKRKAEHRKHSSRKPKARK